MRIITVDDISNLTYDEAKSKPGILPFGTPSSVFKNLELVGDLKFNFLVILCSPSSIVRGVLIFRYNFNGIRTFGIHPSRRGFTDLLERSEFADDLEKKPGHGLVVISKPTILLEKYPANIAAAVSVVHSNTNLVMYDGSSDEEEMMNEYAEHIQMHSKHYLKDDTPATKDTSNNSSRKNYLHEVLTSVNEFSKGEARVDTVCVRCEERYTSHGYSNCCSRCKREPGKHTPECCERQLRRSLTPLFDKLNSLDKEMCSQYGIDK